MNTSNITNYKPKDFAELLGVSVKTLQRWDRDELIEDIISVLYGFHKYKNQIKGDEEIAKELQNGNRPNAGTNAKDK